LSRRWRGTSPVEAAVIRRIDGPSTSSRAMALLLEALRYLQSGEQVPDNRPDLAAMVREVQRRQGGRKK
jgi:hypothetical protein